MSRYPGDQFTQYLDLLKVSKKFSTELFQSFTAPKVLNVKSSGWAFCSVTELLGDIVTSFECVFLKSKFIMYHCTPHPPCVAWWVGKHVDIVLPVWSNLYHKMSTVSQPCSC